MASAAALPRPATRIRWGIALLLGFGILINYFDRVALSVSQDPLHKEFGIGPAEFGILSSTFFWVYALCQIPIGIVLDRFGVVLIGRIGAFLWGIAAVMSGIAPSFGFPELRARVSRGRGSAGVSSQRESDQLLVSQCGARTRYLDLRRRREVLERHRGTDHRRRRLLLRLARSVFRHGGAQFRLLPELFFFYRNPSEHKRVSPRRRRVHRRRAARSRKGLSSTTSEGARLGYLLSRVKVWGLTIGFCRLRLSVRPAHHVAAQLSRANVPHEFARLGGLTPRFPGPSRR